MKKESVPETVRRAGFRATAPRVLLLSYLREAKRPQSVVEIASALKKRVDQVTVYRILDAFTDAGLVRELDLHKGRPLYEIADVHDHHHVVCVQCERIEDFTGCEAGRIADKALKQVKGFSSITGHSMEFFGLCDTCAKAAPLKA